MQLLRSVETIMAKRKLSETFYKDKEGIRYKFPERSCKLCIKYPCYIGQEKIDCDMAKYGCKNYKDK